MAENKTVTSDTVEAQPVSSVSSVAKTSLVSDDKVQRDYETLVAGLSQDGFVVAAEPLDMSAVNASADFAPGLGATLRDEALVARFEGVKENLVREIRGGMCTADQAHAYLENIEISLLLEQEAALRA